MASTADPLGQLGATLRDVRVERERCRKARFDPRVDELLANVGLRHGLLSAGPGGAECDKAENEKRLEEKEEEERANAPVAQVVHRGE